MNQKKRNEDAGVADAGVASRGYYKHGVLDPRLSHNMGRTRTRTRVPRRVNTKRTQTRA